MTTTTDPNGIQTIRIHDIRGREAELIKKNLQGEIIAKSQSQYDQNGTLKSRIHSVFNGSTLIKTITHCWDYGPMERLECFVEAGEKETKYLYDPKGRLQIIIKPSGIELNHEWDDFGRLAHYFSSDFDYHYTYDRNDRLLSVYDTLSKQKTIRTYNALDGISQEVMGSGFTLKNTFDDQGRRKRFILPDGSEIEYVYQGAFLYSVNRNGQIFTYTTRDLEGHLIQIDLPEQLGKISIERDPLSRIATYHSPFYYALFPKEAYDPVGNLLSYHYQDSLGKVECTYGYDNLNQLISEKEHTYQFDSLHNRIQKNDMPHQINNLCQILDDGTTAYDYDSDGNLIFDGQWHYTYDTQDRLIALEKGVKRIEYEYDPFHRRLSKKVFDNEERIKYERYLWDGDNEIGVIDENDTIVQLRILGEGLGAEIGSALLYELNGKTYIPIHDHRGSVAVLVDLEIQKPLESYRYTAFGEELTSGILSPWRFSSKRTEEETGLLFFGRRYYFPTLGRWITQDPQGFDDGPNLYAYLNNRPLNCIDLHGLAAFDTLLDIFAMPYRYYDPMGLFHSSFSFYGHQDFEHYFSNKSRNFNLNQDFRFNFPEPPIGGYYFGNGVGNTFEDLREKALLISSFSGYNTLGTYNATHTLPIDMYEAHLNLIERALTPPVYCYQQQWDEYFEAHPSGAPLWQGCHSQGTAQVRNALETYPKEKRDRTVVR